MWIFGGGFFLNNDVSRVQVHHRRNAFEFQIRSFVSMLIKKTIYFQSNNSCLHGNLNVVSKTITESTIGNFEQVIVEKNLSIISTMQLRIGK